MTSLTASKQSTRTMVRTGTTQSTVPNDFIDINGRSVSSVEVVTGHHQESGEVQLQQRAAPTREQARGGY